MLAIAFGTGGNMTFIVAVQSVRVLVAVLLAPLAVRRLARMGRDEHEHRSRPTPEIPEDPPPAEDGSPEDDDQPLGPPADLDEDDAPLPGLAGEGAACRGLAG